MWVCTYLQVESVWCKSCSCRQINQKHLSSTCVTGKVTCLRQTVCMCALTNLLHTLRVRHFRRPNGNSAHLCDLWRQVVSLSYLSPCSFIPPLRFSLIRCRCCSPFSCSLDMVWSVLSNAGLEKSIWQLEGLPGSPLCWYAGVSSWAEISVALHRVA